MNTNTFAKPVLVMGTASLLSPSSPVPSSLFGSAELQDLIQSMQATMQAEQGAGLAAPQIGYQQQVVIFGNNRPHPRYPDAPIIPYTVLINPTIHPLGDEMEEAWEGCLSVPGLRGLVRRYQRIAYTGYDSEGNKIEREVDNFHARVVQHECDHLNGILYPMRLHDPRQFGFTSVLFPGLS